MNTLLYLLDKQRTYWLIMEIVIATGLCLLPILLAGNLTEYTLQLGAIIATIFLVPAEAIRHFRLEKQLWQQLHVWRHWSALKSLLPSTSHSDSSKKLS
jgi:hypothetical protein